MPLHAPVEAGSDRHVLVVDTGNCHLYEMYSAQQIGAGWTCASGAVFNLNSNVLRPNGWTSADAAGLPILPAMASTFRSPGVATAVQLRASVECSNVVLVIGWLPSTGLVSFSASSRNPSPVATRSRTYDAEGAVAKLPERYREVITLFHVQQLSYQRGR